MLNLKIRHKYNKGMDTIEELQKKIEDCDARLEKAQKEYNKKCPT